MNSQTATGWKVTVNALVAASVMLIVAGLIWIMYHYTRPGPVEETRWKERVRNLAELNAQNKELLENYAWVNQAKGVVRLPIERSIDLTVVEWQNPSAGRSNLLARLDKALPPAVVPLTTTNPPAATRKP